MNNQRVTQPANEVNQKSGTVEPFPLDVFPIPVRRFVEALADSVGCPVDFAAVAALVACACAAGAARRLRVKDGWVEFSNLYLAMVGDGGLGKSPAMEAALFRRQEGVRWALTHVTTDATLEAIILALRDNAAHGVLYVADSLLGLFQAMNKYRNGKGNDRQALEVMWGGSETITWRMTQESGRRQLDPIEVTRPWLSIFGTTQPDGLGRIRSTGGGADGLIDRFLFCFPQAVRGEYSEKGLDPDVHAAYWEILDSLFKLQEATGESETVEMSPEAADEWVKYARWHQAQENAQPEYLRGAWIKLQRYTARFALTLQLVYRASGQSKTQNIEAETVRQATRLTRYFASQAARVYRRMRGDEDEARIMQLVAWMQRRGNKATVREVLAGRVGRLTSVPEVIAAFSRLQQMGMGRFLAGSGRAQSSVGFELTPNGGPTAEFAESSAE